MVCTSPIACIQSWIFTNEGKTWNKENQGALFTCLTQNWIPWQIAHNHTIHQIVYVWLAPKCLTYYKVHKV